MSPQLVTTILGWAAPPVIGAIIGYVTNDIAVRMLFRPLREIRVLGVRLPFTPGVFPKERHRLARSIGQMVSRELITEEALRRQIHEPRTLEALAASVRTATGSLLDRPLGSFATGASPLVPTWIEELLADLAQRITNSRAFIHTVRDVIGRLASSLAAMRLSEAGAKVNIDRFLAERILPLLSQPEARGAIAEAVATLLSEQAGELASDELLQRAVGLLEPALPSAVERLLDWVRSPETRSTLEREARKLLASAMERLNVLQRFIVSAGQFDRRLDERMPEIVGELIAAIERVARDSANQARVLEALGGAARDWRDSLRRDPEKARTLATTAAGLVDGLLAGLADAGRRERAARALRERLARGDATLGGIARRSLGLSETDVAEYLSARALEWMTRAGSAGALSREFSALAHRFVEEHAATPLAELLGVHRDRKATLDAQLTDRLVGLIDTRLPEILRGVDVEQLVVRKIEGLDVRDVERLLLQVIATHLRWIDWFGAILGFLIGLGQLLLRLVAPQR